jgi:chorismate synthase
MINSGFISIRALLNMSGNTFGTLFTVTSFGESHGPAIGCVVDGCPPGLACAKPIFRPSWIAASRAPRAMSRSAASRIASKFSPAFSRAKRPVRRLRLLIRNQDQRSKDYGNIAETFRPGHADYTYTQKYGFPRLSRRRPFVGARDGGARRRRGDCPQMAA